MTSALKRSYEDANVSLRLLDDLFEGGSKKIKLDPLIALIRDFEKLSLGPKPVEVRKIRKFSPELKNLLIFAVAAFIKHKGILKNETTANNITTVKSTKRVRFAPTREA